ncbi:Uncharacterized protein dnm_014220 [Desulfonema magnum]|uniref:Uncharacterized protein n=1 Tax=Desulfonema magnum TaxID=45655 RepID=A0A975BHI1_9BACT|nr:Uncharacterized protein dnm_014220 [Desulfonema magnum]
MTNCPAASDQKLDYRVSVDRKKIVTYCFKTTARSAKMKRRRNFCTPFVPETFRSTEYKS